MARFTGREVFEMLSKMSDEERARCRFPGFFDDEEYEILKSEVASNLSCIDDVEDGNGKYQKILDTPNEKVAGLMSRAMDEYCDEWGRYIDCLKMSVWRELEKSVER